MSISIKNIEFLNACSVIQDLETNLNYPVSAGDVWVSYSVTEARTAMRTYLDGVPYGDNLGTSGEGGVRLSSIPNDGLKHTITVVDDGTSGVTAARSTETIIPPIPCDGLLAFDVLGEHTHPLTREKYVHISVTHTQLTNKPLFLRLCRTTDYTAISTPVELLTTWINVGERKTLTAVIPADAKRHAVFVNFQFSQSYLARSLWYTIQANYPPPPVEDPSGPPALFLPGETIVVASSESGTPLETDGSEWVMLEMRPRPESGQTPEPWTLAGDEGGYITPQEDGSWIAAITTDPESFPSGSKWDVRARRFREFRPSEEVIRRFNMGTEEPPPPQPPARPLILGETQRPRIGTWMNLIGTGTPNSVIEFDAALTNPGDVPGAIEIQPAIPASTTVGPDGTWKVRHRQTQPTDNLGYAAVSYRARAKLNGATSEWSPAFAVTWQTSDW